MKQSAGGSIVVIGSINMDLVFRAARLPRPGETVLGDENLLKIPGGKGANQAVAAARLGAEVHMVGRVGDDEFGRELIEGLLANGVGIEHVSRTHGVASGCAAILVDRRGENSIVVSPGANARVKPADVDAAEWVIRKASVVVLQLEIPIATVRHAIATCRKLGVKTILDPAPVPAKRKLPSDFHKVDVFTPNEYEADQLAHETAVLSRKHRADGSGRLLVKLGAQGAVTFDLNGVPEHFPPYKVKVVDTTAAGDAFTGALAVAMAEGKPWTEAIRFANAAGAVCCTKVGAQPSLPTRAAVEKLISGKSSRRSSRAPRASKRSSRSK